MTYVKDSGYYDSRGRYVDACPTDTDDPIEALYCRERIVPYGSVFYIGTREERDRPNGAPYAGHTFCGRIKFMDLEGEKFPSNVDTWTVRHCILQHLRRYIDGPLPVAIWED